MWDEAVTGYNFGPSHPMDPVRLSLTRSLVEAFGLTRDLRVVAAPPAGESTLRLVHRQDYLDAVRRASAEPLDAEPAYGLGTEDDPAFPRMHEASALIAGQSVGAAEAVWGGEADHAVNFAGGLHHAMPGSASGFCVYNDAALAVARLLELGAERVAYVDVDVHHGDGVQAAFWDDPRVLTISLHEHPRTLFPQTGWPGETGGNAAEGRAVNIALPAGTGDEGWLRAFHAVVPELLSAFRPQVLVSQHGADTHFEDPLAHLDGDRRPGDGRAVERVHARDPRRQRVSRLHGGGRGGRASPRAAGDPGDRAGQAPVRGGADPPHPPPCPAPRDHGAAQAARDRGPGGVRVRCRDLRGPGSALSRSR